MSRGRLIKKKDQSSHDNLEIQGYPWLHFTEDTMILPDNARSSVVLTKFHDPEELRQKVKKDDRIGKSLQAKNPITYPQDLTVDYRRHVAESQIRQKNRILDEEALMALEFAQLKETRGEKQWHASVRRETEKPMAQKADVPGTIVMDESASLATDTSPADAILEENREEKAPIESATVQEESVAAVVPALSTEEKPTLDKSEETESQGYAVGFAQGHAEGLQKGEAHYQKAFEHVHNVIERIEQLKEDILGESRVVFSEIIKICAEKILREQVKISDEILIQMFEKVVKDYHGDPHVELRMNPEDAQRMKGYLQSSEQEEKFILKEDPQLEIGDFQVETKTQAARVDLKKSVEEILEELGPELFSDTLQAS